MIIKTKAKQIKINLSVETLLLIAVFKMKKIRLNKIKGISTVMIGIP
jgi:hypothetical protein